MSHDSSNTKSPFYARHAQKRIIKVEEIEPLPPEEGQPGFVQFAAVNRYPVAFLGEELVEPDTLLGKFMRVDRMVVPGTARMVNIDTLQEIVKDFPHTDNRAIDLQTPGLFYEGQFEEGVLLDVSGTTRDTHFSNLHFHPCMNKGVALRHSHTGSLTCPDPVLSPAPGPEQEVGRMIQKQIIFHIGTEELNKKEGCFSRPGGLQGEPNLTIAEMIKDYFTDIHYPEIHSGYINWERDRALPGGIFLIPISLPDNEVIYLCIPNVDGPANQNMMVKFLLGRWLHTLTNYYKPGADIRHSWLGIAGNDFTYLFVDEWSVSLCKNAEIFFGAIEDIFKAEVLETIIYAD